MKRVLLSLLCGTLCSSSHAQISVEESYQYNWSVSFVMDATQTYPEFALACDTPVLNTYEEMGLQMKLAGPVFEYPYMVSFMDRLPLGVQEDLNIFLKLFETAEQVIFFGVRFQNVFTLMTTEYEYYELPTFVITREWPAHWLSEELSLALQMNVTPQSLLYSEENDEFFTSEEYIAIGSIIGEFP